MMDASAALEAALRAPTHEWYKERFPRVPGANFAWSPLGADAAPMPPLSMRFTEEVLLPLRGAGMMQPPRMVQTADGPKMELRANLEVYLSAPAVACAMDPRLIGGWMVNGYSGTARDAASRRNAATFLRLLMLYSALFWEWRPDLAAAQRVALAPYLRALNVMIRVESHGPPLCDACMLPGAAQKCSRCRTVCYCDAACQRKAWGAHKSDCRIMAGVIAATGLTAATFP